MFDDPAVHGDLSELYERSAFSPDSKDYLSTAALISELERVAKAGWGNAAFALAEQWAKQGPSRDLEKAYKWFNIAFAWSGYKTTWSNQNGENELYLGISGDFRNESVVAELVDAISHSRLQELDAKLGIGYRFMHVFNEPRIPPISPMEILSRPANQCCSWAESCTHSGSEYG